MNKHKCSITVGKQCPICYQIMYEDVGTDCNDYYRCDKCRLSIRILHERININSRFNRDIDITGCS